MNGPLHRLAKRLEYQTPEAGIQAMSNRLRTRQMAVGLGVGMALCGYVGYDVASALPDTVTTMAIDGPTAHRASAAVLDAAAFPIGAGAGLISVEMAGLSLAAIRRQGELAAEVAGDTETDA